MTELALLDAIIILFVLYRAGRAGDKSLGDSLHSLITLLLIIGLFLGLRINREMREVVAGIADLLSTIPGLGSKLLVILIAWYLTRLLREKMGYWIEQAVPEAYHKRTTVVSETVRAIGISALLVWLTEWWFNPVGADVPASVRLVRHIDAWVALQFH